ncbi:ABC transporter ATP-binding protein [Salipiger sp. IMCC34102]|uniref:ATP-binding cassette domain-containing protein n=1 Tax=Salipiger sp. IMCC34102 TaxID=2510647 RepID=UPI00101DAEFD|nr:ATP-binding cassette domain-containing protein [Salipiger sp. IMCC34102]RYH04458.1 ABC transporter ATP-binding protein [Salipiger sp. IMCC34102]
MATGAALDIQVDRKALTGGDVLFRDLHLQVAPSEVLALVGPSGVGKSTLLRLIAGADRDFAGTITIDKVRVRDAPPPGFVFQDPRLLPWLDAVANVRSAAPDVSRERALDLLGRVGLEGAGATLPHMLSGGMARRVALARALALSSRLLLLDEPFVSLDADLVTALRRLLTDLLERHPATVILVSHVPEDAAWLADRIVVLKDRPVTIADDFRVETPRDRRTPEGMSDVVRRIESAGKTAPRG